MAITKQQAIAFSDQQLRPLADRLAQAYYAAVGLLNYWNANGGAGILPPATITPTPSTTGGTLGAGTRSYRVSALNALGETLASSAAVATTTGTTASVSVAWAGVGGATSYNVYGRAAGAELLLANAAASPWVDTGAATPGAAPPASNTTGLIPNDSEMLNDTALTQPDGRPTVTGIKLNSVVNRALDLKNLLEGSVAVAANDGSKSLLNALLAVSVNPGS